MLIDREQLKGIVLEVACREFGVRSFARRELMNAVERSLRASGGWTAEDDTPSASAGPKSRGLAMIDWVISSLKQEHRLANPSRDLWRIPARHWPALISSRSLDEPSIRNGAAPDRRTAEDRARRLDRITARAAGPAVPDAAIRRENLYDAP